MECAKESISWRWSQKYLETGVKQSECPAKIFELTSENSARHKSSKYQQVTTAHDIGTSLRVQLGLVSPTSDYVTELVEKRARIRPALCEWASAPIPILLIF
jgi:hypothetical protein